MASQMMTGQIVDKADVKASLLRPIGRPRKEKTEPIVRDNPDGDYHNLTAGQIDDIKNSDIMFLSVLKHKLCAGFYNKNSNGEIPDNSLPASIIEICTDIESKKLKPTIKEIIEKKFVSDPTGGFSTDDIRERIRAERDSVNFGKTLKNEPVD